MIELVVMIVIMGILAAVAYPRLSSDGFDEAGYRDQVISSLAFARKAAVAQRRWVRVTSASNGLDFEIANGIPEGLAARTYGGTASRPLILPGSDSARIAPRGKTRLTGPDRLEFSPAGAAASTALVYTITGSSVRTVTVDAATGHVF